MREGVRDMARYGGRREPGQVAAMVVSGLFVLAGVLDVAPGLLDNLVQLAFGGVGLAASHRPRGAHAYLIGGGVAYVLLWQFGTVFDPGIVPLHTDDVIVHVLLVVSMIGLAVLSGGRTPASTAQLVQVEPHVAPARYVRSRTVPSRPPGRGDRRTPPRAVEVGQSRTVLACRV
jgi:uncharacterized protein DUF4383